MRGAWLGLAMLALSCRVPVTSTGLATLEGSIPSEPRGDAYVFLTAPGVVNPGSLPVPLAETGVSQERLARGDGHYVVAGVPPGDYQLSGFLDARREVDPSYDVLSQPGADGRWASTVAVALRADQTAHRDLAFGPLLLHEPPAFDVADAGAEIDLPDTPLLPQQFRLEANALGIFDLLRVGFSVRWVDINGDGIPDDLNGDGIPDLWPQLFLHFLPRPGQLSPTDDAGTVLPVVLPLLFNPAPFVAELGDDPSLETVAAALDVFVVPVAEAIGTAPDGGTQAILLSAIPVGDYELWVVERSTQFWKLPNALGADGGTRAPIASQAVRFQVVHGTGLGP